MEEQREKKNDNFRSEEMKKIPSSIAQEHHFDEEKENLGLDADQSSERFSKYVNLNNDNDRISGNPDGEDDNNDTSESAGYSPLTDK